MSAVTGIASSGVQSKSFIKKMKPYRKRKNKNRELLIKIRKTNRKIGAKLSNGRFVFLFAKEKTQYNPNSV